MSVLVMKTTCPCGSTLCGTPNAAGMLPCGTCGRLVVVDSSAAARATPGDGAADTRELGPQGSALENSLGEGAARQEVPLPKKLGAYRVLGRLGQGGMGVVYKGHDDTLDRPVAIKVLAPFLRPDATAARRFVREARVAAGISHENVVSIFFASEEEGEPYLVMEFVEGRDLRELLDREGPLPWKRAVRYMEQAARGLAAAQAKGLVHRDVKPANLLLDVKEDRVKVADFGLAKARSLDGTLTGSSILAGTPLYVAPEVAREGEGDHRADMYSLGATFFHLLAGDPPFSGKTPAAAIVGHLSEPVPDLAARRRDLPEGRVAVVRRCLAKSPEDRYATWPDLLAALEKVREGRPVEAAPESALRAPTASPPRVVVRPVEAPPRHYLAPAEHPVFFVRPALRDRLGALIAAYLLWLPPLGLLGFHRFYLGRTSVGLLYSITGGFFGLGWLVDLFLMPEMVKRARRTGAAFATDEGEALGTAYLLWVIPWLGLLGAHRYYTGRIASGVLYTFTLGFLGIGWLLDLVLMPALVSQARRP